MPIVDELITLLSFKSDLKDADKTEKAMKDVKASVLKVGLALAAATAASALFIRKSLGIIDTSARFASSIGVSYEKLQELEFAAVSVGGSVDELRGDLEGLTQSMSSPIPGEFNNELVMLGINTRKTNGDLKSSADILGDLSKKFEGMSTAQSFQWGKKLGLSKTTIDLLRKGEAGLKALQKEAHAMGAIVPSENLDSVRKSEEAIAQLQMTMGALIQSVAAGLAPELKELLVLTKKWVGANKDIIKTNLKEFIQGLIKGFQKFKSVMSALWAPVKSFLDLLGPMVGELDKVEVIANIVAAVLSTVLALGIAAVIGKVYAFILAMKAMAVVLLANPIGLVVIAIAALIAIFISLNKVTGSVADTLKLMGGAIMKTLLLPVNLAIKAIDGLLQIGALIPGAIGDNFAKAAKGVQKMQDAMNDTLTGSKTMIPGKNIFDVLTAGTENDKITAANKTEQDRINARYGHLSKQTASSTFDSPSKKAASNSSARATATAFGSASKETAATSSNNSNNITTVTNNIEVNGAGSPQAVGQAIVDLTTSEVLQVQTPGVQAVTIA